MIPLILIVDDSAFTLRYYDELIQKIGFSTCTALGGQKALELFEKFPPSLILCDIMMPDINGYELLEILKEKKSQIPFYFISSEYNESILKKALSLGAKGVLEKPLTEEKLRIILSALSKKE